MIIWLTAGGEQSYQVDDLISVQTMEDNAGVRREMIVIKQVTECGGMRIACLNNMDDDACDSFVEFEEALDAQLELKVSLDLKEKPYAEVWSQETTLHDVILSNSTTPTEFLLHYRDILLSRETRGWYPFEISIERQQLSCMFSKKGNSRMHQREWVCFDLPLRELSNIRVTVPVSQDQIKRGYLDIINPELPSHQFTITMWNENELRISAFHPRYDSMLPAVSLLYRDGKNYVQRFYPRDGMTEDLLRELLQRVDGQQCW